jgi:hypothetical protein
VRGQVGCCSRGWQPLHPAQAERAHQGVRAKTLCEAAPRPWPRIRNQEARTHSPGSAYTATNSRRRPQGMRGMQGPAQHSTAQHSTAQHSAAPGT